jgi:hypothetical protein
VGAFGVVVPEVSLKVEPQAEGGIVLDLSQMKALDIDAEHRTAWAQTGLTAGQYTTAAGAVGLATGFGDTGSVGIGGITLGGGVGYLVRKHGLTIDDLLAAEVVTADGRLLRVDDQRHPDLFWAIRGGGNFGVATRFQFRLHPVSTIVGGMLILPATPEVIAGFITEAQAAPEELSAIANVMPAPPMPFLPAELHGKLIVMAMLVYAGDPEAGERAVAPFRKLATPLADLVRPMPYPEIYPPSFTTLSVTGVPAGTSTTLGMTSISLSTILNDCGEPSGSWVAAAGAGAPPVSSSPTRPRTWANSTMSTNSAMNSTPTTKRSTICSKVKVGLSSPVPTDLPEAAMTPLPSIGTNRLRRTRQQPTTHRPATRFSIPAHAGRAERPPTGRPIRAGVHGRSCYGRPVGPAVVAKRRRSAGPADRLHGLPLQPWAPGAKARYVTI